MASFNPDENTNGGKKGPITPADINAQTFSEVKHGGYDPGEVDEFLDRVAADIEGMLNKIADLKHRLTATEEQLAETQAQLDQASSKPVVQQQAQPQYPQYTATERQISAALISAQQTADRTIEDANIEAERIINDAKARGREQLQQAMDDKQKELDELDRLKASREDFKNEYLKLLQHFMDDAQNSFPSSLLDNTPSGSESSSSSGMARSSGYSSSGSGVSQATVAVQSQSSNAVSDPFAPLPDFGVDDLD